MIVASCSFHSHYRKADFLIVCCVAAFVLSNAFKGIVLSRMIFDISCASRQLWLTNSFPENFQYIHSWDTPLLWKLDPTGYKGSWLSRRAYNMLTATGID